MAPLAIAGMVVLGTALGSILNPVLDRLPSDTTTIRRPGCPNCYRQTQMLDLAPLAGFAWRLGRCRYCRTPLPLRAPAVELACAALFGVVAWRYGLSASAWVTAFYLILYVVIFIVDLKHELILTATVASFALFPLAPGGKDSSVLMALGESGSGLGVGLAAMLLAYLVSPSGRLGEGDVKLGALIGATAGLRLVPLALAIGAGAAALFLIAIRLKQLRAIVPFGPFLCTGAIVALLAGEEILDWYLGLMGFWPT